MDNDTDQREDLPVGIIPLSYWESIGHDREDAENIVQFQTDLEELIFVLKNYPQRLAVVNLFARGIRGQRRFNGIISHVNLFCHLWNEFANVWRDCNYDVVVSLIVSRIQLPKVVLDTLAPIVEKKCLKQLTLSNNDFGSDGILFVSRFLEQNSTLLWLQLKGNPIDELSAATYLSEAITKHPTLSNVTLTQCSIGNDNDILSTIVNAGKNLRVFGLNGNNIGTHGAKLISRFLAGNTSLATIFLSHNILNDDDAIFFSQALKHNTSLKRFVLDNNKISLAGEGLLNKATLDNSSLNAVAESNHTCNFILYDEPQPLMNVINGRLGSEKSKKRKCIIALCAGGHVNLRYLDSLPVEIIPNILEFIQQASTFKTEEPDSEDDDAYFKPMSSKLEDDCLTMIFEVLRGWKMPLLFCYR